VCKRLQESCEEMGCEALVVGGYVVVPVLRDRLHHHNDGSLSRTREGDNVTTDRWLSWSRCDFRAPVVLSEHCWRHLVNDGSCCCMKVFL